MRIPPQTSHVRVVLAGPHPGQHVLHRAAVLTLPAAGPPHRPVHFSTTSSTGALLVQPVDVLRGHDAVQLPQPLEVDDRFVAGVGLGSERRVGGALAPRLSPDLRIGEVVLDRRHLLRRRVLRPHALRTPEVGDARVREMPAPVSTVIRSASRPTAAPDPPVRRHPWVPVCPAIDFLSRDLRDTHDGHRLPHHPTDPAREVLCPSPP